MIQFTSDNTPRPGDRVIINHNPPGPFTVESVSPSGMLEFTDRHLGWQLHPSVSQSRCTLYEIGPVDYDPNQNGDTIDDI
jgi:hypothetical protein